MMYINNSIFGMLLLTLIFNDNLGYSILSIPLIGYLYICIESMKLPIYYKDFYLYNQKMLKSFKDKMDKEENLALNIIPNDKDITIANKKCKYVLSRYKTTLIFGERNSGKTLLANIMVGNILSRKYSLFIGDKPIQKYSLYELKKRIELVNNSLCEITEGFNLYVSSNQKIYAPDFEKITKCLKIEHLFSANIDAVLNNTDRFLVEVLKKILENPYIIIFDNIIVEDVLTVCKLYNIMVIIFEQRKIENKQIDECINL